MMEVVVVVVVIVVVPVMIMVPVVVVVAMVVVVMVVAMVVVVMVVAMVVVVMVVAMVLTANLTKATEQRNAGCELQLPNAEQSNQPYTILRVSPLIHILLLPPVTREHRRRLDDQLAGDGHVT